MTRKWRGAALALVFTSGAVTAADASSCTTYDEVLAAQQSRGVLSMIIAPQWLQKVVLDTEAITGVHTPAPTRGFLLIGNGYVVAGLEVDGCLLDPVYLARGAKELAV